MMLISIMVVLESVIRTLYPGTLDQCDIWANQVTIYERT